MDEKLNKVNVLRRYILLNIMTNKWKVDTKINSIQFFSYRFNLSHKTVSQILINFKTHGLIYSVPSKGYYVSKSIISNIKDGIANSNSYKAIIQELDTKKYKTSNLINLFLFENKPYIYTKKYLKNNRIVKKSLIFVSIPNKFSVDELKNSLFIVLAQQGIVPKKQIKVQYIRKPGETVKQILKLNNKKHLTQETFLIGESNDLIFVSQSFITDDAFFEKKELYF